MRLSNTLKLIIASTTLLSSFTFANPTIDFTHATNNNSSSNTPSNKSNSKMIQQVWNLKDADIRAVIQTVSMLTGKNFIVDPRVQGKITFISQKPMSVDELYNAFLSMLQVLNYMAVPNGNVTKILPSMDATEAGGRMATATNPGMGDELVVRIVPVNNVSAAQLTPVLRPLMPQWASITAYSPSNALILAGSAGDISRLVGIIHSMDSRKANEVTLVPLRHANASKIVAVINNLQSSDRSEGKVSNVSLAADEESNSILVSGNYANTARMKSLISQLDSKSASDGGDTTVIYLNYLTAKKLAPVLTKIAEGTLASETKSQGKNAAVTTPSSSGISIQPEENDNALIIHAPRAMIADLTKVVKKLDVRPQQVLVEAIIVRIDESLLNQLGIIWSTVQSQANGGIIGPNGTIIGDGSQSTTSSGNNTFALKVNNGVGFINGGDLQALIHALTSHGSTDILSTPSIMVLNNQSATISDGQNIGLVNRQYQTSNVSPNEDLGVPFNTVQRQDVALSLKVTPQISPNNTLRLKLVQKDDAVDAVASSDPENPVIDTSQITTNVLVRSGDILVLGGLIDNQQKQQRMKIPVLGDIPLIGQLFSYTNHDIEKKDLMVFLRPIILNSDLMSRQQTMKNYDYMRAEQIKAQTGAKASASDMPLLPDINRSYRIHLPAPTSTSNAH